MNKKIYMLGLPLLALALVSAVAYYGFFSASFNVVSAISISECSDVFSEDYFSGDVIIGSECIITNNANTERTIRITEDSDENIDVSYVGDLVLTKKNLTDWIPFGETKTITYTIIGEDFVVSNIPDGYTLIYYPNTAEDIFTTNVANVKVLVNGINDIENLPIALDVGDNYCTNGYNPTATLCIGGKLWLIAGNETTALVKLNSWDASEFYFETELIQYNVDGIIMLSNGSSLTITPIYTIGEYASGEYIITTTIV